MQAGFLVMPSVLTDRARTGGDLPVTMKAAARIVTIMRQGELRQSKPRPDAPIGPGFIHLQEGFGVLPCRLWSGARLVGMG